MKLYSTVSLTFRTKAKYNIRELNKINNGNGLNILYCGGVLVVDA